MKRSSLAPALAAPSTRLSSLALCIRLALGIAVTSTIFSPAAFAEGTKQWAPAANNYAALGVMETGSANAVTYPFAGYDQPAESRLHIHIADPDNEIVYIGLGNMTGNAGDTKTANYYWRIKAPDGTVVKTAALAGGAASNITSHTQAIAGPDVLNPGGYSTAGNWTFDPAAAGKGPGDYYIEFDINNAASVGTFPDSYNGSNYGNSSNLNINWFDITVATKGTSPQAIDGRVWSKSWGVRTNDPAVFPSAPFGTPFNGSMYAYDNQNFITKIDFNGSGLRPLQGQFSFNNTGTGTTGVKTTDRKSVMNANATTPLHKIFLNQPDPAIYPLGAEGQLKNLPLKVNDPGNTAIQVEVTQPGQVEIVLDFGNDGSFTAGTDRRLLATVVAGINQVPWDGKNGAGTAVTAAQFPIQTMVAYTQGETHFTAYDVEGLDNGFQVYTQTDAGTTGPNLQFWDDSNITQSSGVTPTVLTNVDTGAATRQHWNYVSADMSTGYGNSNTINTWWFAYRDYQTSVLRAYNDAPVASDDTASTQEDSILNGTTVLSNDSDADGGILTVNTTPVTAPAHGTLVLQTDGTYTYTPNANFNGTDSFTYEISDGQGGTATATVTITVAPVNDPPVANDDTASTPENTPLNGSTVLVNDADVDGDTLTVNTTPVAAPAHGTLALNADGTYTYTPTAGYNGADSFSYEISDGKGGTDTAVVNITVNPVNDAPVASDDTATIGEDAVLNGTTVLGNDTDLDGDTLSVNTTPVTAPTHGTLVLNADGTYTYTPDANFNGTDSFTYEVADGKGGTDTATVTLTVTPANDPPTAMADSATTQEDTALNGTTVLTNDTDIDGDTPLTVNTTPVVAPTHGTLVLNADGTYTYAPETNFNGTDSFTYEVSDGQGGTATAVATLTVGVENDAPTATDDTASTTEDTVLNGTTVLGNDSDLDGDTLTTNTIPVAAPAHGTLALKADGTYTYTPSKDYNGTDNFSYEISDGNGGTDTATVTITITPANDPPTAMADTASLVEDSVFNGSTVLANDTDIDGDTPLTVTTTPVAAPTHGTLALQADGTYTYTPAKDFNGTDSFSYAISDGNGGTATATVTLTVTPVNDAPLITSTNNVTFAENGTGTALDVESTDDSDTETSGLTYSLLPMFDTSLFNIDPVTGAISFKAPPDYEAPQDSNSDNAHILMTQVCDSGNLCTEQVEVIVVTNVQETSPPQIISTVMKTPENQIFVTSVAAADPDTADTLTFSIKGGADASLFSIDPVTGDLSFKTAPDFETPADANQDNVYEVIVGVTDNTAPDHTDEQALKVTVTDVQENTAPTITSNGAGDTASLSIPEGQQDATTLQANDAEGDTLTYSITGGDDATLFSIDPATGQLAFITAPDFENPADTNGDNQYSVTVSVTDKAGLADTQALTINVGDGADLKLQVRGFLQGAYVSKDGLMGDTLRKQGLIPPTQPYGETGTPFAYTGTETASPTQLALTGNDAPIDWVLVELRDPTTPKTRTAAIAGLLQRDGDVVDATTGSPSLILEGIPAGQYYVSLRHRNHLGVTTAAPLTLSATPTSVDFTQAATATLGNHARLLSGNTALLWAGDANISDGVIANGPSNDTNVVLGKVLTHPSNTLVNSNFRLGGYYVTDLNMDGVSLFAGPGNDINLLLGNVLLHPGNANLAANYILGGSMPR